LGYELTRVFGLEESLDGDLKFEFSNESAAISLKNKVTYKIIIKKLTLCVEHSNQ
jgi:hypothetical protein